MYRLSSSENVFLKLFVVVFQVEVLVGPDKGKIGEITDIVYERNWCFVGGLHLVGLVADVVLQDKIHLLFG